MSVKWFWQNCITNRRAKWVIFQAAPASSFDNPLSRYKFICSCIITAKKLKTRQLKARHCQELCADASNSCIEFSSSMKIDLAGGGNFRVSLVNSIIWKAKSKTFALKYSFFSGAPPPDPQCGRVKWFFLQKNPNVELSHFLRLSKTSQMSS